MFQIFRQYIPISPVLGKNFILPAKTVLKDKDKNTMRYFANFIDKYQRLATKD